MKPIRRIFSALFCACLITMNCSCRKAPAQTVSVPEHTETEVDVDLTDLSANMVYAQVWDMINSPEKYRRKTVKMHGLFATRPDEKTGELQYGCVIQDALACCAQGIQFIPAEEMQYPEDFPSEGEEITVTGEFDFTMDGNVINCILKAAETE